MATRASFILAQQTPGLLRELLRVGRGLRRRKTVLPWKLEFFTTYSCGSRCKTCLIWTRYEREPEKQATELSAEDFGRVAGSVGKHLRWLSFTGGEITDRDDAEELVRNVADASPNARVLSTSSHGLDPVKVENLFGAIAKAYPKRAIMVTLSLDGLGDTYTHIRGVDGHLQVEESMERLQKLAKTHPNLAPSFQATLSPANFDQVSELLARMNKLASGNVVTIANDSLVLTEGRIKNIDARSDDRLKDVLKTVEKSLPRDGLSNLFARTYLRLSAKSLPSPDAPIPCTAGFSSLTISPYGEILQCDRYDQPLAILQAPDFDIPTAIQSAEFKTKLEPWIGCTECFTPCQAYPSMMQAPFRSFWRSLG